MIGDWAGALRTVQALAIEAEKARKMSLQRFGLKAEALAKKHMNAQDLEWAELKPSTIAAKARKGLGNKILIATSSYFQAITSWTDEDTAFIGVTKNKKGKDGQLLADVARVHEFGSLSGSIPKRELWSPVLKETLEWHEKNNRPDFIMLQKMKKYKLAKV